MPASENSKMLPDIIFQAHSTAMPPEDLQVIFRPKGKINYYTQTHDMIEQHEVRPEKYFSFSHLETLFLDKIPIINAFSINTHFNIHS